MEGNNGSLELQIFPKNVFNGFLHWAHIACWEKYIKGETQFLVDFFVKNGHERKFLETLVKDQIIKRNKENNTKKYQKIMPIIPKRKTMTGAITPT